VALDLNATRELVKKAMQSPVDANDPIIKTGWAQPSTATTGIAGYNLQAPANLLIPSDKDLLPLTNETPAVGGQIGIQANWRNVTSINSDNISAGVAEGHRGGVMSHASEEKTAAFKTIGLEDAVSFQAEWSSQDYDNNKQLAQMTNLQALLVAREQIALGGNCSIDIGTASTGICPTPSLSLNTDSTSTGLSTGTLNAKCVAIGYQAYWALAGNNLTGTGNSLGVVLDPNDYAVRSRTRGGPYGGTDSVYGNIGRISSAAGGVTIDGSHMSASLSVTAVPGACAYAWYIAVAGSSTYYLFKITELNSVKVDTNATTTIQPGSNLSTNYSKNALEYDGYLTQAFTTSSGAYIKALATGTAGTGTTLTSDGAGGITEIDDMLQDRWQLFRLGGNAGWEIFCNSQQFMDIGTTIVANGGAPLVRYNFDGNQMAMNAAPGAVVMSIPNKATGGKVDLRVHPVMPKGMMMARAKNIPYKLRGINNVYQFLQRRPFFSMVWPINQPSYEFGTYCDEVLQVKLAGALGIIYNIAPGADT
jgi:hypothetical protein